MADVKHTPAPWDVIGPQGSAVWAGDEIIAQSAIARSAPKVAHANACLMAAAPDLLESLRAFVSPWDGDSVEEIESQSGLATSVRIEQARAAIAKATGAARATEGGV